MSSLPSYEEALALVLALVETTSGSDRATSLADACGRVLTKDVHADRDLPPFNRAMMDGYALRAADFAPGRSYPVIADIPAGASPGVDVPVGACVKIATGSAVPAQLDTVIQHEWSDRGGPGDSVRFTVESIERGHAIHPRGVDAKRNDVVIRRGTRLGPHHIGIAAMTGQMTVLASTAPIVAIFTSGDEVRGPHEVVEDHQIRNSNGPMLIQAIERFGGRTGHKHVRDEMEHTIETMRTAYETGFDLAVTVGGVSAGDRDHFPASFDAIGFDMTLTGARIQPGKPVQAGRMRDSHELVIGLPGNPVSALVCAHLFVWPVLRKMSGDTPALPWRTLTLRESIKPNPHRQAFRPAILHHDQETAIIPNWAGSGDLIHTSETHGFVALPTQEEPIHAGTPVRFLPWI